MTHEFDVPGQDAAGQVSARRAAVVSVLRLALVALYSLALVSLDALHFEAQIDLVLIGSVAFLWLVILGIWLRGLIRSRDRRSYARRNVSAVLLLVAPVMVLPDASWLLIIVLLTAYILDLRRYAAGHGFLFSFGLVLFVIVLATGVMAYVESSQPDSKLGDVSTAAAWSFATLLKMRHSLGSPQTDDGQVLGLVVGVCALLAASLFTAQVVTWVSGSGRESKATQGASTAPDPAPAQLQEEIAALRVAVDTLTEQLRAAQGDRPREDGAADGPAGGAGSAERPASQTRPLH